MPIKLTRIDEKLMHAQIIWGWFPIIQPTKIIIANDDISGDNLRKKILMSSAEPILCDTKLLIVDLKTALSEIFLNQDDEEKIMLILGKPADVVFLAENNAKINKISLGYMSNCLDRKKIFENLFLNQDDIKALRKLIDMGIDVEYQLSPTDTPINAKNWLPNNNVV